MKIKHLKKKNLAFGISHTRTQAHFLSERVVSLSLCLSLLFFEMKKGKIGKEKKKTKSTRMLFLNSL